MNHVGVSPNNPATCPLAHDPKACFARYQDSHLQKRNRHSWESIGECHGCKFSRINAEIAQPPPEPDDREPCGRGRGTSAIDPNDFLEQPPKRNGPKPKDVYSKGHPRSTFGVLRKDGRWRCKICDSARYKKKYQRQKAA